MFKIINEPIYEAFKGLALSQVIKWKRNHWKCMTEDDFYMDVEISLNIVKMKLAEVEYDLNNYNNEVLEIKLEDKFTPYLMSLEIKGIDFKSIMQKMSWPCDEDQIWDM